MKTRNKIIAVGISLGMAGLLVGGHVLQQSKAQATPSIVNEEDGFDANTSWTENQSFPAGNSIDTAERSVGRLPGLGTLVIRNDHILPDRKPGPPELELELAMRQEMIAGHMERLGRLPESMVNQLNVLNAERAEAGLPPLTMMVTGPLDRRDPMPGAPTYPSDISPEQAKQIEANIKFYQAEQAKLLFLMKDATPKQRENLTRILHEQTGLFVQEHIHIHDLPEAQQP
jgi:hypothetical protein